jgi:hypothetical protein
VSTLEVVHASVERLGRLRLVAGEAPTDVEFVSEVLRIDNCLVDESTQAVFPYRSRQCHELTWLHPREQELDPVARPVAFVEQGILPPIGRADDDFRVIFETCAALHVAGRAGVLHGARIVGRRPPGSLALLDEALALYGGVAGASLDHPTFVQVGTLFVPRFWVRPVGSDQPHFSAPSTCAVGYSHEYVADLRSRLLPVPNPAARIVAVDPGTARVDSAAELDLVCDDRGAVLLPDMSALGLADRAATYARIRGLVTVDGVSAVNLVFMPTGAWVEELGDRRPVSERFAALADLCHLEHSASVVPGDEGALTARVGAVLDRHGPGHVAAQPVYVLTGVWDNADLLDDWLEHLQLMGVAGVLAMDYGSTDGSYEILTGSRWSSFVTIADFPGIAPDHDPIRLGAARLLWQHGWALLIDPDEFLVTPTGRIDDPALVGAMVSSSAVELARYELTTVRSEAADLSPGRPDAGDLRLRWAERDMGKVAIDLDSLAMPTGGAAHYAQGTVVVDIGGTAVCLLHAPTRTFGRFEQKVEHAAYTLSRSVHQDPGWAWHWRRWIAIRDEGGLRDEYLSQFVADDEVDRLIDEGVVLPDGRLVALVALMRARRANPL